MSVTDTDLTRHEQALRALFGPGARAASVTVAQDLVAAFGDRRSEVPTARIRQGAALVSVWGSADVEPTSQALAQLLGEAVDQAIDADELVAALVESQNQVLSLYEVSRIQSGSLDSADVDARLLSIVAAVTRSDAVALITQDQTQTLGEHSPSARLRELIAATAWVAGGPEQRMSTEDHVAMLWPLPRTQDDPPSALAVLRQVHDPFLTADAKLLTFLGDVVASARRAAIMHEEALASARLEREHDAASRLARALLPPTVPVLDGCEAFQHCEPANSAGGDFVTHAVVGDSTLYFAVGDVAGKGLPAALVMAKVVGACRAAFGQGHPTASQIVARLHAETHEYLAEVGLFVTILVGSYHTKSGDLDLANAGHSPVMLIRNGQIEQVRAGAPPIGVLDTMDVVAHQVKLRPGDMVVVGSDGLTEQLNCQGEQLGQSRFTDLLRESQGHTADDIAQGLLDAIRRHANGTCASDDQTLLVIKAVEGNRRGPDAQLTLDASTADVRRLGPWLAGLCRAEHLASVELATHELCINIVEHAYANTSGTIRLSAWHDDTALTLEIRDDGRPCDLDPNERPDPGAPQIRGYGLHIVKRLMSRVLYERRGSENVWTLEVDWETPR